MKSFSSFNKNKKYLLCVDSDGCVMDTMNLKHSLCFGPCLIDEWGLYEWRAEIIARWKKINLYNITRGINRFKGLSLALSEINEKYTEIPGVNTLAVWVENASELSNAALQRVIEQNPEEKILLKALSWSIKVNEAINSMPKDAKLPFPYSKEALSLCHRYADVAIISSANLESILEEWNTHALINQVDVVMSQSNGSKEHCIAKLINKGYDRSRVIMCGDALGDLVAAEENKILFFPILAGRESQSWAEFISYGFPRFLDGNYLEYEKAKKSEFYNNLNK